MSDRPFGYFISSRENGDAPAKLPRPSVPQSVVRYIAEIVQSGQSPYRTSMDFVRDAIGRLLEDYSSDGAEVSQFAHLARMQMLLEADTAYRVTTEQLFGQLNHYAGQTPSPYHQDVVAEINQIAGLSGVYIPERLAQYLDKRDGAEGNSGSATENS